MSIKSVAGSFVGFLGHHFKDLAALDTALSGILAALPVNAETRAHIQDAIDTVRDSAVNVENAVSAFIEGFDGQEGGGLSPVTIKESDIEHALSAIMPAALAAYFADHPVPTATDRAAGGADNVGLTNRDREPVPAASEQTADSQAGTTGSGDQGSGAGSFGGDTTVGEQ
jgi:hypothetical protein